MGVWRGGLQTLVLGLWGWRRLAIASTEVRTSLDEEEAEGRAAYARGASGRHCPYPDKQRSAAWTRGFRRAESLDASVW
jgi:ribosome modulation factor